MRAQLRAIHSPDVDDFEAYVPPDPERVSFLVQLLVGPVGGPGEEAFDLIVCTSGWLADQAKEVGIMTLRHYVLIDRYSWPRLRAFFEKQVNAVEGDTWQDVAARLGHLGRWEFEDYEPYEP